jgi:hypothetical protein
MIAAISVSTVIRPAPPVIRHVWFLPNSQSPAKIATIRYCGSASSHPPAGGGAGSRSSFGQPDQASCFLPVMFSAVELFWPSPGMRTHATR